MALLEELSSAFRLEFSVEKRQEMQDSGVDPQLGARAFHVKQKKNFSAQIM